MVGDIDDTLRNRDRREPGTMGKALRGDSCQVLRQYYRGEIGSTCKSSALDGVHTIGKGQRSE